VRPIARVAQIEKKSKEVCERIKRTRVPEEKLEKVRLKKFKQRGDTHKALGITGTAVEVCAILRAGRVDRNTYTRLRMTARKTFDERPS